MITTSVSTINITDWDLGNALMKDVLQWQDRMKIGDPRFFQRVHDARHEDRMGRTLRATLPRSGCLGSRRKRFNESPT